MISQDYVQKLFDTIDRQDANAFAAAFAAHGVFRFGNAPSTMGSAAITEVTAGFFAAISGLKHQLVDCWEERDATMCHGQVTYTRHDDSTLSVPFAVILRGDDEAVSEYLIFVDNSALFAPSA